ncbi:hypothetical protein ACLB2K_074153 [Fragaria x ananassa]
MKENQLAHRKEEKTLGDECQELLLSLPKERGWVTLPLYQYQGFWCPTPEVLQAIMAFQRHFQARDSDIVVASSPKCGTTWLKALIFAVVNRYRFDIETHPLVTSKSHKLVPFFDLDLYANNQVPDFSSFFEPRLFATRPYFFSFLGYNQRVQLFIAPSEAFDRYCMPRHGCIWSILGSHFGLLERLKRPNSVLFFKYEDMKIDIVCHLKTLTSFIDYSFTEEEERNSVIEDVAKLCSFETMKKLEINKTGMFVMNMENKYLFRKAAVGDWVNYFTPEMEERMSKLIEESLVAQA